MRSILLAVFVGSISLFSAPVLAQQSPASRIGIINLRLAYDNLQERIDSQKQIAGMQKQLDQITASRLPPKPAPLKLGTSTDGTPPPETDQQRMQLDNQEQSLKLKLVRAQARQLTQASFEINAAVADIARARGLEIVLVTAPEVPENAADIANPQTIASMIFNQSVLYAGPNTDITAEVIAFVNKSYKALPDTTPPLPTVAMKIGGKTYQIEIAADDASREHGLMERDALPPDHGMIFVFPDCQDRAFWMHHTRFALDIIFADSTGRVVSTRTMKPYDERSTYSDGPAQYAIELAEGQIAASGIKAGDKLVIPAQAAAK